MREKYKTIYSKSLQKESIQFETITIKELKDFFMDEIHAYRQAHEGGMDNTELLLDWAKLNGFIIDNAGDAVRVIFAGELDE